MEITLKNGEKILLDWNPIVLEYLEDYEGGIEQLKADIGEKQLRFRTLNFVIYCMVSSVYPEELTYREAVSLVQVNDLDRIVDFIVKNVNSLSISKKNTKDQQKLEKFPRNYKKHRR